MFTQPHYPMPYRVFDSARKMLPAGFANRFLEPYLLPQELEDAWTQTAASSSGLDVFPTFLEKLAVDWTCSAQDMARIPRKGPLVVVANHPFGMVEGAVLGALLSTVRPDTKFLANSLLSGIPGLDDLLIPVNPFTPSARSNSKQLRHSLEWLRRNGVLVTFPAGEVSALRWGKLEVADPEWNEAAGGLIRISGAAALPIFFHGSNGAAFQIAGLVHPRLRTVLLPRELLNKRGTVIHTSIGRPISADQLAHLESDRARTDYLRERTHLLGSREPLRHRWSIGLPKAPVAGPVPPTVLAKEVANLKPEHVLAESGDYQVLLTKAAEIPEILGEIGRLRELTFRRAGEGTGRSLDLDRFDKHYHHLWLWNKATSEVCGAYRLAGTDEVPGLENLYTSTLFKFRPGLLESVHPALELGRSFIRPEYQKSYQALLLLWRGIGSFVARNPRYRVLFGPVSISREYGEASRGLMVSYFEEHPADPSLAGAASPRKEFRFRKLRGCDVRHVAPMLAGIDELSDAVADLEPDGKGLPVLLRQYLNMGAAIIGFNVDQAFSGVVDGLILVDLGRLNTRLLAKYLGKPGAEAFQEFQAALPPRPLR